MITERVHEFIDTFVFVLAGGMRDLAKPPASARSTAAPLTLAYALGNGREAHFNPAGAFGGSDGYNLRTRCGRVSSAPSSSCSLCA